MKNSILFAAVFAAGLSFGRPAGEMKITADKIAADNVTGALAASGSVRAVAWPVIMRSEFIGRSAEGKYVFSQPTAVTTCTNEWHHLHWKMTGEVEYENGRYLLLRNMWVRMWDVPVFWSPYWYYPMDTDYGWRVMPGYTSRWGAFLLTKYVYGICGSMEEGRYGLAGNARLDLRTENGVALGQTVKWNLAGLGKGKFKVYYAWDEDADRYDRHWNNSQKWNYRNWSSDVPDERYGLSFEHRADLTERDVLRVNAGYYSDSYFHYDFLRRSMFGQQNRFEDPNTNEAAWEHLENSYGLGVSVAGAMNDFYESTARLPEFYFDVNPQPLFSLPVNYESQSRIGYLNRDYARYGDSKTDLAFRYSPGIWADYNAFRFDTYHRLTLPMKFADVLSAVPRFALRGTFWSDSGYPSLDGKKRAGSTGDELWRTIVEGGVTFAARGRADLGGGWAHVVEPYLDVLAQEADYSGLSRGARPYIFDSLDASRDWLDQFAGRSRNLPYSWYGVTPGLRNVLLKDQEGGFARTVLDFDLYCAVQFNDTSYTEGDKYRRLAADAEDPNYGEDEPMFVPGARVRWLPAENTLLAGRAEFDTDAAELAYADIKWAQRITDKFNYYASYCARDHRRWDFSPAVYDPAVMTRDEFNRVHFRYFEVGFEHEICDAIVWSPFLRWDFRENEIDEVGTWIDYRTDCLGFRFSMSYENDYLRVDGSEYDHDWSFGFFIYLRALGPSSGTPFGD
jgi:hypothetical protein